jgi:hypothetical protein
MNHCEKTLVILMRLAGVLLLTALIPAVMPFAWMKDIHRALGMGELPEGPIMGYLIDSRPGEGTTIIVDLPIVLRRPEDEQPVDW